MTFGQGRAPLWFSSYRLVQTHGLTKMAIGCRSCMFLALIVQIPCQGDLKGQNCCATHELANNSRQNYGAAHNCGANNDRRSIGVVAVVVGLWNGAFVEWRFCRMALLQNGAFVEWRFCSSGE